MCDLNLCTFPSRLMAEITRNRNGNTRSVKCSHFGIFSVVNRPYFVSQTIPYNVLVNGSSRNLTPRKTTRDAFKNKYMCPRINLSSFSRCELRTPLLKLLNCKRNNNVKKSHPSTPGLKVVCKRVLFSDHG